jgi:hypothetical protein
LGERLLCKQEVVGSIPSGSTSRDRDQLRSRSIILNSIIDLGRRDFESQLNVELFESALASSNSSVEHNSALVREP